MIKIRYSVYLFITIGILSGLIKEVLILYSVILIHELGHIIMIKLLNEKINSIEITPIGCFINLKKKHFSLLKGILIYSGGIVLNLVSLFFIKNYTFIKFTYTMISFNLIPIVPLDGYQIINQILSQFYDDEFIIDLLFYIGLLINSLILFFSIMFKIYFLICLSIYLFYRLLKYRRSKKIIYMKNLLNLSI